MIHAIWNGSSFIFGAFLPVLILCNCERARIYSLYHFGKKNDAKLFFAHRNIKYFHSFQTVCAFANVSQQLHQRSTRNAKCAMDGKLHSCFILACSLLNSVSVQFRSVLILVSNRTRLGWLSSYCKKFLVQSIFGFLDSFLTRAL